MGAAFAILAALFWAIAVVLFKKSGESCPPLPLNLFKNLVAAIILVPATILVEGNLAGSRPAHEWLLVAVSGVLGFTVSDTLFLAALNRLGAGLNAVVNCLYSPAVITLAILVLGEQASLPAIGGGILVVLAIVVGAAGRPLPGATRRDLLEGALLGALGMVVIAGSIVMIKPILEPATVLWVTTLRLLVGTAFLAPIVIIWSKPGDLGRMFRPSPAWRVAIPAAVFGSVLAVLCWIAGMTLMEVTPAAILNQLSTIFVFALAAIVLGEPVTRRRTIAVALAFAGAILVVAG